MGSPVGPKGCQRGALGQSMKSCARAAIVKRTTGKSVLSFCQPCDEKYGNTVGAIVADQTHTTEGA